jgi:tetratricopeptide (TPR) repeat protein
MDARTILEEVRAGARRRFEENGYKRLPANEESELRKWEIVRYSEAIELDPSLAEAYVRRGAALYSERRRAEAQADMRKAFALRPNDPVLYHTMASPFEEDEKREILQAGMSLADPSSFEYEHLRDYFILTYWYDGNFTEHVRLLEEWLPELDQAEPMYRHELRSLAQSYSALAHHERAEATYRRALAVSVEAERAQIAEMVVRTRMHRGQYAEAREVLAEFRTDLPPEKLSIFDAALLVLLDPTSAETRTACNTALPVAEPLGKAPGPVGNTTSYYSFLLGVIYKGAGRQEAASELLGRFAAEAAANKREWAITLRWEIAAAREAAA